MRGIERAEILSIGSEITVGETRDTNAGELAALLTAAGVEVRRVSALPDELPVVRDAFEEALADVDLVVSTGGLGPTPDDLTRESIAAALGEVPAVDADLEAWLRDLFSRRKVPFAATNMKQAWLIPSATAIPERQRHGTRLVGRSTGRASSSWRCRGRRARCGRCGGTGSRPGWPREASGCERPR